MVLTMRLVQLVLAISIHSLLFLGCAEDLDTPGKNQVEEDFVCSLREVTRQDMKSIALENRSCENDNDCMIFDDECCGQIINMSGLNDIQCAFNNLTPLEKECDVGGCAGVDSVKSVCFENRCEDRIE
jgi:hypothetical protein